MANAALLERRLSFECCKKENLTLQAVANFAQQNHVFWCCFWCWCFSGRFALQAVNLLDHQENDEGEDDEVDGDRDEVAVGENRDACLADGFQGMGCSLWNIPQCNE